MSAPEGRLNRFGLTVRSLVLGVGGVLLICLGAPYSIWIVGSSEITWSYFPIGVGVPFVLMVFANALLRRYLPGRALAPWELIVVLVMGLVASGIPAFMVGYLLAIPSKPYYGATPENEWAAFVQPYLPEWAIPATGGEAMRHFYEGLPAGHSPPWGAWLEPLAWWLSLILAVYFACFCLVVILRRQWVEHERLVFPLTEVPRLLVEVEGEQALPPLLRTRIFWIGAAVPLSVILVNMLSYFHPGFAQIAVHQDHPVQILRGAPPLNFILYFPVVGFMYLVSTAISFSIWFFFLFSLVEMGLLNWAGVTTAPDAFVWGASPTMSWQGFGAFAAMVVWSLWMGRRHLAAIFRHVFRHSGELQDGEEMVSYRVAVFGFLLASLYVLGWLWRSGMDAHVALLYFGGVLVIYLGLTRLVIQAGMHYLTTPLASQAFALAAVGTAIAPHNLVALALSYSWCGDIQSVFMPSAAHAARLGEVSRRPQGLALAMGIAVVVGFAATIYFMLHLCYQYGAGNFRSWIFQPGAGAGGIAFDAVVRQMRDPLGPAWDKLGWFAVGAALYSLLSLGQYRFHWWPLHPVGLAVAPVWMIQRISLSIFLAWAFKSAVLRLGGVRLYRQLRPFFVGLIVGFFVGVGLSYGVDAVFFFGKGHPILHG